MAKASIALTELAEKGSDVDLVRDVLHLGLGATPTKAAFRAPRAGRGEKEDGSSPK